MKNYTLGIDMGVASIGWACVSTDDRKIDSGVRVYPAGLDNFNSPKEKHANQDRRGARTMRRRIRRKAERKANIRKILQDLGWMPKEDTQIQEWHNLDVYQLRHHAINEKISLPELARIILQLNQRRGFLSLRKTDEADADKESKGMLGDMNELEKSIDASGHQTFGNYLYHLYLDNGTITPNGKTAQLARIRGHHFRRNLLYKEFDLIWTTQAKHHPELTSKLRWGSIGRLENPTKVVKPTIRNKNVSLLEQFGIENITFFQRKVYWPESSIGKCELEQDEARAPISDRRFQEFRMLQEVNNLRFTDHSTPESPTEHSLLDANMTDVRDAAVKWLTGKKSQKIDALKKHLCKAISHLPDPAQLTFNLEAGGRTMISATNTDDTLKANSAYGSTWNNLPEKNKNLITEALTRPAATDEDIRADLEKIDTDEETIERLLRISLPSGYGHLSIKALEKLLPHMRLGMIYMHKDPEKSALAAAGYKRRDELTSQCLDSLPAFEQIVNPPTAKQLASDPNFPNVYDPNQAVINNPVVLRSLTELRKIVNALIKKHGKPARIHLEMARDLKMSPKQRKEHQSKTRGFEKERDEAVKLLEQHKVIPTGDAIRLVRLWKEQKESCPYCSKSISIFQLLGGQGDIDVDHIFPFSRSADDSMMNKVVCHRECNAGKTNRTPREWLANSDPERYEQMIQRTKKLPSPKAKRFYAEEIPDGFIERDLRDTAWMARAARQYLARIMPKDHLVQGTKGMHTSMLRDHWQLHALLRNDGINLKNRDDHRHHALDAIVIALCDQSRIKSLLKKQEFEANFTAAKEEGKKIYHLRNKNNSLETPWGTVDEFRGAVAASLNAIWVSHRPKRKVSGPLHKETNYGKTEDGKLVVRKAIQNLSKKEVAGIRDPEIQRLITQYIRENGGDLAVLKSVSEDRPLTLPSGIPIKKVRVAIPYSHITLPPNKKRDFPLHVQSESTHHLAIFSLGDDKHYFAPVTLLEATARLRSGKSAVDKTPPPEYPEAEYLFHLCSGDSMMATIDGIDQLFVFNTMAITSKQTYFTYHTEACDGHKDPVNGKDLRKSCMPGTFTKNFPKARKVTVLPNGEIREMID